MPSSQNQTHNLAFTGGTLTMGYVDGAFLKQLSSEYESLHDTEHYLFPLFDIRHIALAASIDEAAELPQTHKNELYAKLVETEGIIKEAKLAEKNEPNKVVGLEKQLDRTLSDIARQIKPLFTVGQALASIGLSQDSVSSPYFIDSINYNEREQDEKLYQSAKTALEGKKQETFYVAGGTDSLVMYAGKVTRRLIDEGIISEANGNKVIFLNAMKSFGYGPPEKRETEETEKPRFKRSYGNTPAGLQLPFTVPPDPHITQHPQHIGRLFRRAAELTKSEENGGKKLPAGGYLLCPTDEHCQTVGVHDVRESMKAHSQWIDAFRSKSWYAGVIEAGQPLHVNSDYRPTLNATSKPGDRVDHVEIAPPLISGNSNTAVLNYLQRMPDHPVMIIGGIPTKHTATISDKMDWQALDTVAPSTPAIPLEKADAVWEATLNVIRERAERGMPTYYVNPDRFDINKNEVHPLISPEIWKKSDFLKDVEAAGGILVSGETTIGAYHDIQRKLGKLTHVTGPEKIRKAGGAITRKLDTEKAKTYIPMAKEDPMGIEYIPDKEAFTKGFKTATTLAKTVVLSAMPDAVTPGYMAPLVKDLPEGHKVMAAYEYANSQRRWIQHTQDFSDLRTPSLVTPENGAVMTYAPAEAFVRAGGGLGGDYSPAEIMNMLHHQAELDGMSQTVRLLFAQNSAAKGRE